MKDTEMTFTKAIGLAGVYHANQTYGDGDYFVNHILKVVEIAYKYLDMCGIPKEEQEKIVCAAAMHDMLEDTTYTYDQMRRDFGIRIADIVLACTDDDTLPTRKEKKADVYRRLVRVGPAAIYVKLCDRLANVSAGGKNDMYRKEHTAFRDACYLTEHKVLWDAIETELYGIKKEAA